MSLYDWIPWNRWDERPVPNSAPNSATVVIPRSTSSNSGSAPAGSTNNGATVRVPSHSNSLLDDIMSGGPGGHAAAPATVLMPQAGPPTFSHDTRNDRPRLDDLIPVNSGQLSSPDETDAEWLRLMRVNPYAIAPPPPPSVLRFLNRNRPPPEGGTRRRLLCKSKKGGKKGVRKSKSVKRCRRKGKRSRKVHRR